MKMKNLTTFILKNVWLIAIGTIALAFDYLLGGMEGTLLVAATQVGLPIKSELAEKELIKKFRHDNTWLTEIKSKNNWVNKNVIKIPKQGAAPGVLINNGLYPIVGDNREDSHVLVSLNKYDTENTIVTDDELYGLPYEKVSDVQMQHREELEDKTAEHALHSIAPDRPSNDMPILETTGDNDGTGRKKLTSIDLINLKKEQDVLNVPKQGRILVLCPDHVADLLDEDRKFFAQYQNHKNGMISTNYYGFKIYEANYAPSYNDNLRKRGFGSTPGGRIGSVLFHKRTTIKARGSVIRYARNAKDDPNYRQSTLGFRLYFVCVAIKDAGQGAIISGVV